MKAKDAKNVDVLCSHIIRRAIIDWLAYHDSAEGTVHRRWFLSADAFFKSDYFEAMSNVDSERMLGMLEYLYKKGGYSSASLERLMIHNTSYDV